MAQAAHVHTDSDGDWEICEAPVAAPAAAEVAAEEPAPEEAATPGAEAAAPARAGPEDSDGENDFLLVDTAPPCDAPGESDTEEGVGGLEAPPAHLPESQLAAAAGLPRPLSPASEFEEDPAYTAGAREKTGSEHSDGSSTTADDGRAMADEEPPCDHGEGKEFLCGHCHTVLFRESHIESDNFQAESSPGYLLAGVLSGSVQAIGSEKRVSYTTGDYCVQAVGCTNCGKPLGVTYTQALGGPLENQQKVGKYLVGVDRLELPEGVVHKLCVRLGTPLLY